MLVAGEQKLRRGASGREAVWLPTGVSDMCTVHEHVPATRRKCRADPLLLTFANLCTHLPLEALLTRPTQRDSRGQVGSYLCGDVRDATDVPYLSALPISSLIVIGLVSVTT
ncbi:unnamed protein product, partial [Iphiclides podalirius]